MSTISIPLKSKKRFASAIAVLALLISSFFMAAPAQAASWHYGTDPQSTGCSADAYTIATRNINTTGGAYFATLEVRYSPTCGTNWTRFVSNNGSDTIYFSTWADGGSTLNDTKSGTGSIWSRQVYAPGTTCINFAVSVYRGGVMYAYTPTQHMC